MWQQALLQELRLGLRLVGWLQLGGCGFSRLWGLAPVQTDVDGPRHTVARGWGCRNCRPVAVAAWWGWRRRQQILGLIDQLLLLLFEIAEAVLGAAPAIDEMNHGPHQITEIAAALKGMATFLVAAKAIHQIIAGIFDVTGDRQPRAELRLVIHRRNGESITVPVRCRLDTAEEASIYEAGGVLQRFAQDFLEAKAA